MGCVGCEEKMVLLSILPAADRPNISRITYKDKLAKQQKDKDKDKDKGRIVEFGVVHMGGELTARSNIAHNHVFQSLHNHVFAQKTRLYYLLVVSLGALEGHEQLQVRGLTVRPHNAESSL